MEVGNDKSASKVASPFILYLLTSVQALGRKAQALNKLRLMQTSLKKWRVASRESLFYQIREKRLQSRALVVWKGEMDRVEKLNGNHFSSWRAARANTISF